MGVGGTSGRAGLQGLGLQGLGLQDLGLRGLQDLGLQDLGLQDLGLLACGCRGGARPETLTNRSVAGGWPRTAG